MNVFNHIYFKEHGKKTKIKIRKEPQVQEYPNKPFEDTFMDKLYDKSNAIVEF